MLLARFTYYLITFQAYLFYHSAFIWTLTSTGVSAATIRARQLNETDVPAGGQVVVSPIQETLLPVVADSLLITEDLGQYLQINEDQGVVVGNDWSPIELGWDASGDGSPAHETELTTEVLTSESVNEPEAGIESRMDVDDAADSRIESGAVDAIESRMDVDDAGEGRVEQPDEPATTPAPIALPPVRFTQKPVRPSVASESLVPPPPPSPPLFNELRPFNPVTSVKSNVWDVRLSTQTLTKAAPPGASSAPPMPDERLDYDYSGEELPPSLPNLDIIRFVAADAVVGASPGNHEEDERLIHKTMREDLAGGKRPGAAITPGQQLNEKEAPPENRRNLWLIDGTRPVSDELNQSNAAAARNHNNNSEQHKRPSKPPVAKLPAPRPTPPTPPPRKTIDAPVRAPSAGFGSLRVESCNIYGQMYYVGKIIAELSSPCSECKCTEVGVSCFDLKC